MFSYESAPESPFFSKQDTKIPVWFNYTIAVAALAFIISVGITVNLGGQIMHIEIRTEEVKTE